MAQTEYMHMNSKYLSPEIRELYGIDASIADDGCVYIKMVCHLYGIKKYAVIT